ncbi:MAG: DMT family transporter [Desulfobacterales bacterium]|jgi:drug/metabolite transporter (DMT)-like permease
MNTRTARADALLLLTATIWGFAFVAQRVGMDYVGPFTFNGVRFALGSLSLVPLLYLLNRRPTAARRLLPPTGRPTLLGGGALAGLFLFAGASLQQVGLVYTTAGNAGFITGLYVVIVPIMGLALRQRTHTGTWLGAFLAAAGLYFLCISAQFTIAWGDLLELVGAIFWAAHVLIIGWLSPRMDALKLAITQFAACSLLSLLTALAIETITWQGLWQAAVPILYGGLGSVGVAYTLQVVAQRDAPPAHAAIFLSMEAVFAAFGGWLLLSEVLTPRAFLGCGLMLAGMLLSQLWPSGRQRDGIRPPEPNASGDQPTQS